MQGQRRGVTSTVREMVEKWENGYQDMEITCLEPRYADKKHHTGQ